MIPYSPSGFAMLDVTARRSASRPRERYSSWDASWQPWASPPSHARL